METATEVHAGVKICRVGPATERPCWRPATEADLEETEPTLCALHMQVRNRTESMDGYLHAIEATQASIKSKDVEEDPFDVLHELALGWYEELTEKAAKSTHKLRVADFLAAKGPNDPGPKNSVMREYGAHLYVHTDAISNAFSTLVGGREFSEKERLVTIAAIKDALGQANEEFEDFRREQGLRD
jgi:hypothetical protein